MADAREWKTVEQQVLDKLDIQGEYAALGVSFARDTPTASGWLACHAMGRKDDTASAAVNVGDGSIRGRFRDMGGDGLSLNLWEFAAKFGRFADWRAARRHYAERAGVELPAGGEPKRPADAVEFLPGPAAAGVLRAWAEIKGGFDLAAVQENGGVHARYPKRAKPEQSQYVAAFPAFNPPALADGEPSAWVVANVTGEPITLFRGAGKPPTRSKTLSVGGSIGGILGLYALTHLEAAEFVWKVEGLSDLLTLHAALAAAGLLGRHVALSNSQGSLESVRPEWAVMLKGKVVYVVHDRDRPGEAGAERWCRALHPHAAAVRAVELPYPMKDSHGEDVRDFLRRDGRPVADLVALAAATAVYSPPAPSPDLFSPPAPPPPAAGGLPTLPAAGAVPGDALSAADAEREREADDLLRLLGIEVLGEYTDSGAIDFFSATCRKVVPLDSIDRFSYRKLVQACGHPALRLVHDGKDRVEGKYSMEEVRIAVALKARQTDLTRTGTLGQGVWRSNGHYVVVNGGGAAVFDRATGALGRLSTPRLGTTTIIDFSAGEPWVDFATLGDLLARAADPAWAAAAIDEAAAVFANWNWKHPQDAMTTALLVAATFVQTVWAWRPEVAITGPSDCGKALSLDTPLPTPSGWTTMGEVAVGDELYDEAGRPCRVVAATDVQHDRDCFRLTFDDGESVLASDDHRWAVRDRRAERDAVMTTRELAESPTWGRGRNRFTVRMAGSIEGRDRVLSVHPYVLGAWLGDGHSAGNRTTTGGNDLAEMRTALGRHERLGEPSRSGMSNAFHYAIGTGHGSGPGSDDRDRSYRRQKAAVLLAAGGTPAAVAEETGLKPSDVKTIRLSPRSAGLLADNPFSLKTRLRWLGVLDDKHIPADYLRAPADDRVELLRGLMDTDGTIRPDGMAEYCTKSERLRDDVLELLAGLGFKRNCYEKVVGGRTYYRIAFSPTDGRVVFRLARKAARQKSPDGRRSATRRIVSVEPVPSVPVRCVQVDSSSHLFLCGRGMVPTHNSTLMTTLKSLFGKLELYIQKPTEAGLRQAMANTARCVLIDEFENDGHRQKILELLRTTSQGGVVVRGSSDQKGKVFRVQHIPWMAAIESGLTKAADRNRFIILDLQALAPSIRGRVTLPGELTLAEIGLKLCAVALRYADRAAEIFKELKGTRFDGIHGRVVESFSTPAALRAAVLGLGREDAVAALGDLLADRSAIARQGGGDEADLMKAILDSTFMVGSGSPPLSVSEVVCDQESYLLHGKTLESQGIAMTQGRPGIRTTTLAGKKFIFLDLEKVRRYLLRGTSWYPLDCEQLLMRLPGANRVQRMLGGQRIWGIEVPARDWVEARDPAEKIDAVLPFPGVGDDDPADDPADRVMKINFA